MYENTSIASTTIKTVIVCTQLVAYFGLFETLRVGDGKIAYHYVLCFFLSMMVSTTGIIVGGRELLLRHDHVGHRHGELEARGAWQAADGDFGKVCQRVFPPERRQHQPSRGLRP